MEKTIEQMKNKIKNYPCGECGGSGMVPCEQSGGRDTCPTCNGNKTVDLWDEWVEWASSNTSSEAMFEAGNDVMLWVKLSAIKKAEILTTPHLLIQSFNSFMEGRK